MKKSNSLLALALIVGAQVPLTIEKIHDGTVKALVQLLALLVLVYACTKVDLKEVSDSIRPPRP